MNGDLKQAATVAVMLGIVVSFVAATGYQLVLNEDSDATPLLVGALVAAFGAITQRLFGGGGTA